MITNMRHIKKLLSIVQCAFIMSWLSNLISTDSIFYVYALCAALGIFCVIEKYLHDSIDIKSSLIVIGIPSALFSLITIIANYNLFSPLFDLLNLFNLFCSFFGGFFLFVNIFSCIYNRAPLTILKDRPELKLSPIKIFFFTFITISLINIIHLFFVEYPGTLTPDSTNQMRQIFSGVYSNHHPYWHTMVIKVFVMLGYALFQDINAAVTIYFVWQIMFMAAVFSYSIMTLYQTGINKIWLILSYFVFAFMPYNIANMISMLKDIPFGGAVLLFVVAFYRIIKNIGNANWNYSFLGLAVLFSSVWRSNGFLALFATALVFSVFLWKEYKKVLLVMFVALIFGWTLKGPVLSVLDVEQPDLVESLSIPVQQVARVIHDGESLTEDEHALLSKVVDVEEIAELYIDWLSDPIKDEIRSKNNIYFEENIGEYLKLWVNLFKRYPVTYAKAWIDQTKGYWNGGYDIVPYTTGVFDNSLGLEVGNNNNPLAKFSRGIFKVLRHVVFLRPFESIGLNVWIMVTLCYIGLLKRRKEFLLTIPSLMVIATLLVATPVYSQFRYAYPIFTTLPFILPVSLCVFEGKKE